MKKVVFNALLVTVLILSTFSAVLAQNQATGIPEGLQPGSTVTDPRSKIHPNLLKDIEAALGGQSVLSPLGAAEIQTSTSKGLLFVARMKAGTDLSPYAKRWFARAFVDPQGNTVASGFASAAGLLKMAALPQVLYLQQATSLIEAPAPVDPDVEAATNAAITPAINTDPNASPGPAPEGWYSTTGAIHGSQDAWAKGYTGTGVRYMSNDSGADYCHPDLHGTWGYIDDAASPYYGLPEMFDSWSSYMAAFDYYLGTTQIADGFADYADTSATTAGPTFSYTPMGAAASKTFAVTMTSLSGVYHYGSHPDKALADVADILGGAFGDGTAVRGERAGVLVVDENTAGVYDTVYVDLNYNYDFSDDAPARLTRDMTYQETACFDYDADNLADVSGGLVYFISDGVNAVPTLDWFWGIPGGFFGNGDLVAFHVQDFTEGGGTHGQGTTSVAVGQGVVAGSVTWGPGGSPVAGFQGLVVGPGKDVLSTQNGDQYLTPFIEDAYIYSGLGYDGVPGTGDDIQIVSNSWGFSGTDNDGWDGFSRLIDDINRSLAPNTALLFSTGNGAAGYGTSAPPSPPSGISIGASTEYGSIGSFEAIASDTQIVGGDVMSWSNRGPGARNATGVDVVATGAFGTGDLSLNEVLWGAIATDSFGGTSMSAPVAAGNLALIYQAWYDRTGSWPTFELAKWLLMGSSKNTYHDVWTQGAGLVNADEGTDVAGGLDGVIISPSAWSAGDYRGVEYDGFANIMQPGSVDENVFLLHNFSSQDIQVNLRAAQYTQIGSDDYSFTSLDRSLDHGSFTTPDYAFQIDQNIPAGTDMLMVRVTIPHDQFDPDEDLFEPFSNWRVHLQNWTDLNSDGNFWDDTDGDGKVSIGEMDANEHIRFTYGYDMGPTQQARIAKPLERMADGILLTFRHRNQAPGVDTTDLTVEVSYWQETDWPWVNVPATRNVPAGTAQPMAARVYVPAQTALGMYEGAIIASYGSEEVVVPVTVAVAADGTSFAFGKLDKYRAKGPELYRNDLVYGYTDYSWRAESGDWRFFWTDIADTDLPTTGTPFLVVDNMWEAPGNDIDTLILGPSPDGSDPSIYGPYTLEEVGRSANTYIGSGRWGYQTSSGGPRELVAAPAQEGLHGIFFHQVRVDGRWLDEVFGGNVGLVTLDPDAVVYSGAAGPGTLDVTIASELDLGGFVADGFGLGGPVTTTETIFQDNPNDPSTASFVTTVTVNHAALLDVTTGNSVTPSDIDLFVYDPSGSLAAASTTSTDAEHVSIQFPQDGDWTIAVHGWSVPAGTDTFDLTINAVQGFDVSVTNLPASIPAGGSDTITVNWDTTGFAPGTYFGLVLMGPAEAPGLLQVPVQIDVIGGGTTVVIPGGGGGGGNLIYVPLVQN